MATDEATEKTEWWRKAEFDPDRIERGEVSAMPCPECGGYMKPVETTDEEEKKLGCGRRGCCALAFECIRCGCRQTITQPSPEME